MKKFLLIILFFPFFSFANQMPVEKPVEAPIEAPMNDEQIKENISGLLGMAETYGQANVVHYDDKGVATLHMFKCDNENKKYKYLGYEVNDYKIEDNAIYLTSKDSEKIYKLKVTSLNGLIIRMEYDMPEHSYDKINLIYIKMNEIRPLCSYIINDIIAKAKELKK